MPSEIEKNISHWGKRNSYSSSSSKKTIFLLRCDEVWYHGYLTERI
jgi:hypothetical protein